jgi:chitin synthase
MFKKSNFFSTYCPGLEKPPSGWDNIKREIPEPAMTVWVIHDEKNKDGSSKNYLQLMKKDLKGVIAKDETWISQFLVADPVTHYLIIAYDRVYDVSGYMNTVQVPKFLGPNIKQIINGYGKTGQDATRFFEQIKTLEGPRNLKRYLDCMDEMFFIGKVDKRSSPGCIASNMIVLTTSIFIVIILGFKFIAALQFSTTGSPQSPTRYVICAVPCYNEGPASLRSTFASVAMCNYSSEHKLLFVVVDGVVRGKDNSLFTSDIVLDILGWRISGSGPPTRMYHALGEDTLQLNMGKVYSGVWEHSPTVSLPYVVVVKTGQLGNNGNRGKRGILFYQRT